MHRVQLNCHFNYTSYDDGDDDEGDDVDGSAQITSPRKKNSLKNLDDDGDDGSGQQHKTISKSERRATEKWNGTHTRAATTKASKRLAARTALTP